MSFGYAIVNFGGKRNRVSAIILTTRAKIYGRNPVSERSLNHIGQFAFYKPQARIAVNGNSYDDGDNFHRNK